MIEREIHDKLTNLLQEWDDAGYRVLWWDRGSPEPICLSPLYGEIIDVERKGPV